MILPLEEGIYPTQRPIKQAAAGLNTSDNTRPVVSTLVFSAGPSYVRRKMTTTPRHCQSKLDNVAGKCNVLGKPREVRTQYGEDKLSHLVGRLGGRNKCMYGLPPLTQHSLCF